MSTSNWNPLKITKEEKEKWLSVSDEYFAYRGYIVTKYGIDEFNDLLNFLKDPPTRTSPSFQYFLTLKKHLLKIKHLLNKEHYWKKFDDPNYRKQLIELREDKQTIDVDLEIF